jgi:hypothetical protein
MIQGMKPSNHPWNGVELIIGEIKQSKSGQISQLKREGLELIIRQTKLLKSFKLTDFRRQFWS